MQHCALSKPDKSDVYKRQIVDTGSTDATKQIAARYTSRVYDFVWVDDFAAARNFSFSKATKEYILWLDADDVFLESDRKAFEDLKHTLDPSTDLVMMKYHVGFDAQGNPNFCLLYTSRCV